MDFVTRFGAPHLTWLVVALLIQRERQRWHHEVTRGVDGDEGDLPDHAGWTFYRHGIGICLTGPDGETLDVDFRDETGAVIDTYFFAHRIESLRSSPSRIAEPRLWRWRSLLGAIVDGITELVAAGALTYTTEYKNFVTLDPALEAHARDVVAELASPEGRTRWLDALEPGGEAAHVAAHRAWIRARIESSPRPGDLLELAIAGASVDDTVALCRLLLHRKDWHGGRAIELLRTRRDVPPLPEVADLLRAADPAVDHPFMPYHACAYLLEHGIEHALAIDRLRAWSQIETAAGYLGHPMIGELAMLAMEYAPDLAFAAIRMALRHGVPIGVMQMAGLLAAIDQPWCHRELTAAAAEARKSSHSYLAAALRATTSELARRRAEAIPGPAPREPDAIGYTFDEVVHHAADEELGGAIESQRELAAKFRTRYPADWTD